MGDLFNTLSMSNLMYGREVTLSRSCGWSVISEAKSNPDGKDVLRLACSGWYQDSIPRAGNPAKAECKSDPHVTHGLMSEPASRPESPLLPESAASPAADLN